MSPDEEYAEYLRGKRVALVGPSGAYADTGQGELVDAYDVVVRLNWGGPVPAALRADLGARTDVLYKRLLHGGFPEPADIGAWLADGVDWVVTADRTRETPNARQFARLVGPRIPWTVAGLVRDELIKLTGTSPLVGVIAVLHLLRQPIASLDVLNCDFYDGGYQDGYGGQEYRRSRGRPEGVLAETHKAAPQLKYLAQLRALDRRLHFDARLDEIVRAEIRQQGLGAQVVIPARWASSRFPGKVLVPIAGKPMILHVLDRVAEVAPDVIVATDDDRIFELVGAAGYHAILTGDEATGTDRVAHVAQRLKAKLFVNVQADEPLLDAETLYALVLAKQATPGAVVNAMCRLGSATSGPTTVKAAVAPSGRLLYASRAGIPATKDGEPAATWRQMGLYCFNAGELERFRAAGRTPLEAVEDVEILRFLELGLPVQMVELAPAGQAVDLPEHIAAVEAELGLVPA